MRHLNGRRLGKEGIEPSTPRFGSACSAPLSYKPSKERMVFDGSRSTAKLDRRMVLGFPEGGVAFATGREEKRWIEIDHVDFSSISEAEVDHSSVTN
jgi:hypothetical protein